MNLVSTKARKIAVKYFPSDSDWVIVQMQNYCEYLSEFFSDEATPDSYERFCFAVLKLGKTSKEKLKQAIELGKTDYRDLLVSAKFANSLTVHDKWASKVLNIKE